MLYAAGAGQGNNFPEREMKRIYRWLAIGGAIVGLILLLVFASSWFSLGYWFGKNPIFVSHGTNLIENGWRTLDLDFVSLESGEI
jgi:hypothetical protein